MTDLISVIVPVYNVAQYLPRCVDSILNQTYTNLQIILVDDGSTDDSGSICDEYLLKDPRIQVVHQKNGGLSAARNTGIEHAIGAYLSFIDSDDHIHPEFYQRMYTAITQNHADIAVCGFKQSAAWAESETGSHQIEVFRDKQAIMGNFYNKKCATSVIAVNKLYKRSVFGELRYKPGIIHEDEELTYRIFYGAQCVVYISDTLYYYYVRENSITTKKYSQRNLQIFDILKDIIAFYDVNQEPKLKKKAIIRYFKMLQLHMLKVERECCEKGTSYVDNDIYHTMQRFYHEDLTYYRMDIYAPVFMLYRLMKRIKAR